MTTPTPDATTTSEYWFPQSTDWRLPPGGSALSPAMQATSFEERWARMVHERERLDEKFPGLRWFAVPPEWADDKPPPVWARALERCEYDTVCLLREEAAHDTAVAQRAAAAAGESLDTDDAAHVPGGSTTTSTREQP